MSHSPVQQPEADRGGLRLKLAAQKSECAALRAECEMWKDRVDEESRKVAMLEDQLKSSDKNKIKWWTRFQELLARGPSGSLDKKRKRTRHEDGPDGVSNDVDDVVLVSPEGFRGSLAQPSESVGDKYDPMTWPAAQASIDAAESPETPSENTAKEEEEEVSALILGPVPGESQYQDPDEVECLRNGAFPTALGEIEMNVEPRAFSPPSDIVLARFRRANAQSLGITVNPQFHAKAVNRRFLSSKYGGTPYSSQCRIAEATQRQKGHSISAYFCPNLKWSPGLPRAPGLPGLFNFPSPGLEIPEMPMFVGLNVHEWVYMGHYVGVPQEPLSKEEIGRLEEKEWAAWVEDVGRMAWGREIRARVHLRCKGIEPTDEAVKGLLEDLPQISAREIRAAYERREEVMHVMCLKPIWYDADFQKELIDGFQEYEREMGTQATAETVRTRTRQPKKIEGGLNQIGSQDKPRSRKRPRQHSPEV